MIGFELLFSTVGSALRSKNDLVVAVLHWQCVRKGFLCVGIGDNWPETAEKGSELLPNGWNQSDDTYVLRYVNQKSGEKLLIKCVKLADILIISAMLMTGRDTGESLSIKAEDYISNQLTSFDSSFTSGSVDSLAKHLETEVIDKAIKQTAPKTTTNTEQREERRERHPDAEDPLRIGPPRMPPLYGQGIGQPTYGGQWPPPYGGADLDPLGRSQGGMIMDPRNFPGPFGRGPHNPAPGLPPGAVPPGARFDPFGPPGVGPNVRPNRNPRHMAPDPDHLPPPGYDDMFM